MGKKIFEVYLAKEDVPNNEAYAKLDLPASPWELWDAMEKVRLQTDDILYMEIEDYFTFEYLSPHLDGFDSWDFFIWGNLSDLEMLLQKPVENENDGYISKDLLKGLLVRIQDQIQIFRQTIPYFVTDRSSEMPIRIIICEL